ncbi:Pyridoxal-dependent decarboxylase [Kribbella flavida DSM 17836]|uniref:Pyridoxal-dependent decarboxylase n=1 Tax=Kribbella flavida (strain DSM 17836 / JCM 10339 / NBRC 14399) TaxID=479435 RepID=D2PL00_KRIFD|nr:aminotransferase class V-fold PLP-dependent enzyme [Kribbella flavida]ADB32467.1 Pyridoxal-dependent decarboxylase [Kribbella flavida DSM 17836]
MSDVLARLRALQEGDLPTHGGSTLAYVYDSGLAEADEIGRTALAQYGATNGLDPTVFPSLRTLENDLVGWAARLLRGEAAVGTVTSGGTESVLLAVQAARDASPGITSPSMVLPSTAHAAFHKAAHYFGVRAIVVDVDPVTFTPRPEDVAAACDEATVLLVASAPSYAQGVVDPVPAIAAVAAERGVRCHVDACIGGWILPYLRLDGVEVPDFDFAVPGVTSISVDLHKYGYTPKGASILLHRDASLRRSQFFASADWPGYTMLNSTLQSTKSGAPVAAVWAVVHHIGDDGYQRLARTAYDAAVQLAGRIRTIDGLTVLADPATTLVALRSDERADVFTIADEMAALGWFVQPQLSFRGQPASLHLTVSAATAARMEELVKALESATRAAQLAGPVQVAPELAAAAGALDPSTLDDDAFDGLLSVAGLGDTATTGSLPDRMAPVNALLDVAPPRLREALLIAFLDRLMRPTWSAAGTDQHPLRRLVRRTAAC